MLAFWKILKGKPTELPNGLNRSQERKRRSTGDSKVFGLALEGWSWHLLCREGDWAGLGVGALQTQSWGVKSEIPVRGLSGGSHWTASDWIPLEIEI